MRKVPGKMPTLITTTHKDDGFEFSGDELEHEQSRFHFVDWISFVDLDWFVADSCLSPLISVAAAILSRAGKENQGTQLNRNDVRHTTQDSQNKQTKISDLETIIFELDMMVKSGLVFFFILKFYQPLQSCCCPVQKSYPERLNWPGRLAGNSEGASRISK